MTTLYLPFSTTYDRSPSIMSNENPRPSSLNVAEKATKHDENTPPSIQSPAKLRSTDLSLQPRPNYMLSQFTQAYNHPKKLYDPDKLSPAAYDLRYFFYGSLMDSRRLASILGLPVEPHLRPASIEGYRAKLWGLYPALVHEKYHITHGMAYDFPSHDELESQVSKLETYETDNYERHGVMINYEDGTRKLGWTFI